MLVTALAKPDPMGPPRPPAATRSVTALIAGLPATLMALLHSAGRPSFAAVAALAAILLAATSRRASSGRRPATPFSRARHRTGHGSRFAPHPPGGDPLAPPSPSATHHRPDLAPRAQTPSAKSATFRPRLPPSWHRRTAPRRHPDHNRHPRSR